MQPDSTTPRRRRNFVKYENAIRRLMVAAIADGNLDASRQASDQLFDLINLWGDDDPSLLRHRVGCILDDVARDVRKSIRYRSDATPTAETVPSARSEDAPTAMPNNGKNPLAGTNPDDPRQVEEIVRYLRALKRNDPGHLPAPLAPNPTSLRGLLLATKIYIRPKPYVAVPADRTELGDDMHLWYRPSDLEKETRPLRYSDLLDYRFMDLVPHRGN